jgi:hypothetical protein
MICIRNDGFAAALETRKICQTVPDASSKASGMVRVIDESGEDYLISGRMVFAGHPIFRRTVCIADRVVIRALVVGDRVSCTSIDLK